MSRSRNIKPGFFKNDQLAELPFEFRILFQGLWCEADRAGRLEDRAKRIKAEVFPYDEVDVEAGLVALASAGFIERYEANGIKYIQVVEFAKHQNPHCKEAPSTIPAPCKHSAGTEISGTSRADSLIPDSLIPDSGFKPKGDLSPKRGKPRKTPMPEGFALSERVKRWAAEKGHARLQDRFEHFVGAARARGYEYADWDEALMNAIRDDWAKFGNCKASIPGGGRKELGK
jgi:hypothetical protein